MRNLITGGSGFIGSFLADRLLSANENVICIDNLSTGTIHNISNYFSNPNFKFIEHDITEEINLSVDRVWHFASPASPMHYKRDPISTSKINFIGTNNILEIARNNNAKILLASTSEIYGDPEIHPQNENYNGNVSTIGLRSCYQEGKRIAETLCYDYWRIHKTNISIARIFNTYGPKMSQNDGRVISNFILKAINNEPLVVYGSGVQSRSFCYIDDLIDGLISLMNTNYINPINLGNPSEEYKIMDVAKIIKNKINPSIDIIHKSLPDNGPQRRRPDIQKAKALLNWEPKIDLEKGLEKTIQYFKDNLKI